MATVVHSKITIDGNGTKREVFRVIQQLNFTPYEEQRAGQAVFSGGKTL
jgi:hypothetical protein